MPLSMEIKQPGTRLEDFLTLIYGAPGIGKSTLCSQFDGAFFLDTEGGLRSLPVRAEPIGDWQKFRDVYADLKANRSKYPIKILIIDTIDNLYQMCMTAVCEKLKINYPGDLDHGKGWNIVRSEFNTSLAAYRALGYGMIYTSHADGEKIKTRTGEYTRWKPTMSGQCASVVLPSTDFILYCETITTPDGIRRVLKTKPTDELVAKDKTGKLPGELAMTAQAFIDAFNTAKGVMKNGTA